MIKSITVLRNIFPFINEPVVVLEEGDITTLSFEYERQLNDLVLTVTVTYEMANPPHSNRVEVAKYLTVYRCETDGQLKADDLYPACLQTCHMLRELLRFPQQSSKIPRNRIVCPPLLELKQDLQKIADWFHSPLN